MSWPALVAWLGSVALAVVAWQSGWIHLFFLALPVWVLTAVVYTALAAVAGAREPLPAEAAPAPAAAGARGGHDPLARPADGRVDRGGPGDARDSRRPARRSRSGSSLAGAGEWESRLASFKTIAAVITVVYFVAGTAWMNENEKRRAQGAR